MSFFSYSADSGGTVDTVHQFAIYKILNLQLGTLDISITNSALHMLLICFLCTVFVVLSINKNKIIPTTTQAFFEAIYNGVLKIFTTTSSLESRQYFSLTLAIFFFALLGNVIGMFPGAFNITSHLSTTLTLSAIVFVACMVCGFYTHGPRFLVDIFVPSGVPFYTLILIVPIEIFSFLFRPISLAIRLFANMLVGHVLMKVIIYFTSYGMLFGSVAFIALIGANMLELLVAFLQAYVFFILPCVYIRLSAEAH